MFRLQGELCEGSDAMVPDGDPESDNLVSVYTARRQDAKSLSSKKSLIVIFLEKMN